MVRLCCAEWPLPLSMLLLQLEAAEHEFVNKSMQYQQRLGEMEMQLVHQEQKFLARLAIAYCERDKERAELEAAKERHARELHEESLRAQTDGA